MPKIVDDTFGERIEAGPNDSTEDEKELRSKINRANL